MKVRTKGGPTAAEVGKALFGLNGAKIRVGDVLPGEEAFPVRIALTDPSAEFMDPSERGDVRFREAAERILAKLVKDKEVAEPAAFPVSPVPQRAVDVDRDICMQRSVELNELLTTLQVAIGGVYATDFHKFGWAFRVTVHTAPEYVRFPDDLNMLWVRSDRGQMVTLDKLIKFRKSVGPTALMRVNGYRAIIITAAPTSGKTPAEAAARCVKLAQEVLPRGYRVKNLTGPSQ